VLAQGRDHATLAMVAEPPTLDPMASTADLVGTIMQHVYEPLYTFDAKWAVVPMLAEAAPKVSADGKLYTIALRKGVMLHSGRELNADDVVASLQRWLEQSPRGKAWARRSSTSRPRARTRWRSRSSRPTRPCCRNWRCPPAWRPSWPRSRSPRR
jgi:ABC-type transport system substrate-binding protein